MCSQVIKERHNEAEKVLRQALDVEGVNRKKIIRLAICERKSRKEQGDGANAHVGAL